MATARSEAEWSRDGGDETDFFMGDEKLRTLGRSTAAADAALDIWDQYAMHGVGLADADLRSVLVDMETQGIGQKVLRNRNGIPPATREFTVLLKLADLSSGDLGRLLAGQSVDGAEDIVGEDVPFLIDVLKNLKMLVSMRRTNPDAHTAIVAALVDQIAESRQVIEAALAQKRVVTPAEGA